MCECVVKSICHSKDNQLKVQPTSWRICELYDLYASESIQHLCCFVCRCALHYILMADFMLYFVSMV